MKHEQTKDRLARAIIIAPKAVACVVMCVLACVIFPLSIRHLRAHKAAGGELCEHVQYIFGVVFGGAAALMIILIACYFAHMWAKERIERKESEGAQ
jgi:hypothetical protein